MDAYRSSVCRSPNLAMNFWTQSSGTQFAGAGEAVYMYPSMPSRYWMLTVTTGLASVRNRDAEGGGMPRVDAAEHEDAAEDVHGDWEIGLD